MSSSSYNFIPITYKIDRKLYKYYRNIDYAIGSIQNRKIHLDNPQNYNDPFEALYYNQSYTRLTIQEPFNRCLSKLISYAAKSMASSNKHSFKEMFSTIQTTLINIDDFNSNELFPVSEMVKKIYSLFGKVDFSFDDFCEMIDLGYIESNPFLRIDCKMSCFSEVNDSILMWAYYANNHKGICIEYDLSKLNPNDKLNSEIKSNLYKVQYSPIRADRLLDSDENSFLHFLITKSDVWSHEQEWRIICESSEEYLPFDCVNNIYLGVNFDTGGSVYKSLLKAVESYESLKIYKAKRNPDLYKIEFEEIYNTYIINLLKRNKLDN